MDNRNKLTVVPIQIDEIVPVNGGFYFQSNPWCLRRTVPGLYHIGTDRRGLWGIFTNGTQAARIHKGELIEVLGREAADLVFNKSIYPMKCFVFTPANGALAVITRGEPGYRLVKRPVDRNAGVEAADLLNEALGVSKAHVAAMTAGAIFGWDHPDADPRCYNKDGSRKASA
ncbi:MAG: hypothetical protein IKS21_03795 [Oscillospiraceae bacterium]|nr:hypothetical protein [Oscillospiraceae bacterium]